MKRFLLLSVSGLGFGVFGAVGLSVAHTLAFEDADYAMLEAPKEVVIMARRTVASAPAASALVPAENDVPQSTVDYAAVATDGQNGFDTTPLPGDETRWDIEPTSIDPNSETVDNQRDDQDTIDLTPNDPQERVVERPNISGDDVTKIEIAPRRSAVPAQTVRRIIAPSHAPAPAKEAVGDVWVVGVFR